MLDCQQLGNPQPSLTWEREGADVETSDRVTIDSDGRLVFSPVLSSDAGSYTCTATNDIGGASATTVVTVLGEGRWELWLSLGGHLVHNLNYVPVHPNFHLEQ